MKSLLAVIVMLVLGYFIVQTGIFSMRITRGIKLSESSVPFQHREAQARYRMLVIGDSTGVGTGVNDPKDSVAGRLFQDFPHGTIENRARNGARFSDVLSQLHEAEQDTYDLILIQTGGNDILRFTPLKRLNEQVPSLLKAAKERGRHVILMSTGNVGNAPAFFPPFNWIYTTRTRQVRKLLMEVTHREGTIYVDLFMERKDDPFAQEPERYHAADFLHPGSEGYRLWYEALRIQVNLTELLTTPQQGVHPIF